MNTAIVLLVVCAAAVEILAAPGGHHGPNGEQIKQHINECMESTGADRESIKAMKQGGSAPNEQAKCFQACVAKKMGMMNEDGTINKEKFSRVPHHIPEERKEEYRQGITKCAEMTGENECDTAWRTFDCMRPMMKSFHRKQNEE